MDAAPLEFRYFEPKVFKAEAQSPDSIKIVGKGGNCLFRRKGPGVHLLLQPRGHEMMH